VSALPSLPHGLPSISKATLPAAYENAKDALAACTRVDECADWADRAAALASYAKQAQDDALHQHATRIRARAIRRCGELLKQIKAATGAHLKRDASDPLSRKGAASDAGLSERERKTALRVASVESGRFESEVESSKPATVSRLAEIGKRPAPKPLLDLKGRDPEEFKLATQIQGAIRHCLETCKQARPSIIVRASFPKEHTSMRAQARALSAWLERLITSLEKT